MALVARKGSAAPGTSSGTNFSQFFDSPVLNDAGQTAFLGFLSGSEVDGSNFFGIWSEGGDSGLALIARTGNAAPGTSSGVKFSDLHPPVLNDAGHVAFVGSLTDTGVDDFDTNGIWSEGGGNGLALVARSGNVAPGTNSGVNFAFFGNPVLNGSGRTAFRGFLLGTEVDSTNSVGIWSEGDGSGLTLVARTGNAAPGTSNGVNFSSFFSLVLNGADQTAFFGNLTGTGVGSSNDRGIWAEDRSGVLTLIAREGDLLDVDDGLGIELRTIRSLSFFGGTGNEDGRSSGFNDLGQLAFSASFTDGSSGVFVSNLVAVPEPTSRVLIAVGVLGLGVSTRRGKK